MESKNINVTPVGGNIYADLGLPDAEHLKCKSSLMIEIYFAIKRLGLTEDQAAEKMGLKEESFVNIKTGKFDKFTVFHLMECLNKLGCDVEIKVRASQEQVGKIAVVHS